MAPILQVMTGPKAGTKYDLVAERVRMGRHPDCEVVIDVNSVSRFHAHMLRQDGAYVIEDLKSRNGTFVNGKKIAGKQSLKDNDRVKICDVLFVFRCKSTGDADSQISAVMPVEQKDASTVLTTIDAQSGVDLMAKVNPQAKLKAILEISQAIGQTLDLDELFGKILTSLFKIFPQADRALVILQDENDNLIPKAIKHRRGKVDDVQFSRTVVRKALEEKMAILSADAAKDERFDMSQSITDFNIRSIMCVPLLAQDKTPLGVLQVDTANQASRFDADDLQILNSVATQASMSVENAKMHSQILEQERAKRELGFAKEVQQGFLPRSMPKVPGYKFWAFYEAAGEVGGDYYDFVRLPDGKLAAILGDVSGKGVTAALIMAKASSDTKVALLTAGGDIGHAMFEINNAVTESTPDDKFITMVICVIDPKTHTMQIVNAGHMSPMIRRADGTVEEPTSSAQTGLPCGILEDYTYSAIETKLNPGEQVVLFSDGISEAMNAKNEDYGIGRLKQRLASVNLSPDKLGEYILKDVRSHVAGHKQSDDITLVVFSRSKEEEVEEAASEPARADDTDEAGMITEAVI